MSAYGAIKSSRPTREPLPATVWHSGSSSASGSEGGSPDQRNTITVHHLTLETAQKLDGLVEYLWELFAAVVDQGFTYPQEGELTKEAFQGYFFAADVLLGIVAGSELAGIPDGAKATESSILDVASKDWKSSVAGFYYVKPNYPGRSSHICNAGFVVPAVMRGRRYGQALGKSYLHYGPALGYQASVFNLVYVNNVASVRIWEGLGFTKAGRIPSAGRLKKADGSGEEFVDAWVFYKRFSE